MSKSALLNQKKKEREHVLVAFFVLGFILLKFGLRTRVYGPIQTNPQTELKQMIIMVLKVKETLRRRASPRIPDEAEAPKKKKKREAIGEANGDDSTTVA